MAREVKALNDTQIKNAKPKDSPLRDGKGLLLIISDKSKIWRFRYERPVTKKRNDISLGTYPALTLIEARERRDFYRSLLAKGIDPQEYRQEQEQQTKAKHENNFKTICARWFADVYPMKAHNPETIKKNWERLEMHIFPLLGDLPLEDIKPRLLVGLYQQIGASNTLDKLHRLIVKTMDHGIKLGIIESHNCNIAKDDFTAPLAKEHPAIDFVELPQLLSLMNSAFLDSTAKRGIEPNTFFAFNLSLLTGLRQKEVTTLEWRFIDEDKGVLVVPAENLKQTRKLKEQPRDHIIPLSSQMQRLLNTIKRYNGDRTFIFPAVRNQNRPMIKESVANALRKILAGTVLEGRQDAHGLRSIYRSYLSAQGVETVVGELSLAHLSTGKGKVQERYDRYDYLAERRHAMQLWSDYCEKCGMVLEVA